MNVVCGTDFSPPSAEAANVAAGWASCLGSRVHLVHAFESGALSLLDQNRRDYLLGRLRKKLSIEAERLRTMGAKVVDRLVQGAPHRALTELADGSEAGLIVVSSSGEVYPARWLAGSIAEQTAQCSMVPTLAVKRAHPLVAWAQHKHKLNIFVCYDFSASAEAALRWVSSLTEIGSCRITVAYVSWPPQETWRLGLSGVGTLADNPPQVQDILEEDLKERSRALLGGRLGKLLVVGSWGETGSQLVKVAKAEQADLMVVGTNQRGGFHRFWLGCVSREVLHKAPMNVACVPVSANVPDFSNGVSRFKRVVIPTDFSKLANKAIPYGYGAVQRGGEILLVHVLAPLEIQEHRAHEPEKTTPLKQALLRNLYGLIPNGTQAQGIQTRVEVVENRNPAAGIAQAAERFRAELICMASRGRAGIRKRLMGSVTETVMLRSKSPVLVIRPNS